MTTFTIRAIQARRVTTIAIILAAAASGGACRTAPRQEATGARCTGQGLLLVANYTGRVLEIYESGRGVTEFIGFASPGVTRLAVRGPNDIGMAYHVREPAEGRDAATVTWIRRTAVARPPSRVTLELTCG